MLLPRLADYRVWVLFDRYPPAGQPPPARSLRSAGVTFQVDAVSDIHALYQVLFLGCGDGVDRAGQTWPAWCRPVRQGDLLGLSRPDAPDRADFYAVGPDWLVYVPAPTAALEPVPQVKLRHASGIALRF